MTPFIAYILKSSVSLALFYLLYKASFSHVKSLGLNRFVLICILLFSAILPALNFSFLPGKAVAMPFTIMNDWLSPTNSVPEIGLKGEVGAAVSEINPEVLQPINWPHFILGGVAFLLLVFGMISILRAIRILHKSDKINFQNIAIALANEMVEPFTFLNRIVMTRNDFKKHKEYIIAHEQAHIQKAHWVDLLLVGLFCLFHWFNPFMWLLRREVKLLHEYQADEAALKTGIDAQKYQLLVLEKAVGERRFALANQFNQKPILKRFEMIKKKSRSKWAGLKILFFVPLAALMLQAFSHPEAITSVVSAQSDNETPDNAIKWLEFWTLENFLNAGPKGISIVDNNVQLQQVYIPTMEDYKKNPNLKTEKPAEGSVVVKSRNVMVILINKNNMFLTEGKPSTFEETVAGASDFLKGKPVFEGKEAAPEYVKQTIEGYGEAEINRGVISIQYDRGTDKKVVDDLLKSIGEKYLAQRQEKSQAIYQKDYFSLSDSEKQVIEQLAPVRIFIAEPKKFGQSKDEAAAPPPPPPAPVKIKVARDGKFYVEEYYVPPKIEGEVWTVVPEKLVGEELREYLAERKETCGDRLIVNVFVEIGATDKQVNDLKNVLRESGVLRVNYSTEILEIVDDETATKE